MTDPADGTGPINLVTWRPYTHSFADSAYHVLRGDGNVLGAWDKFSVPAKFGKAVRELFGSQKVVGLTTTPAAELYQTVVASLRNPAGQFVAPTRESMAAAAAAMTPTASQPGVLQYDVTGDAAKAATTSYPLTMPVYAALNPKQSDAALRTVYADLIRYAASEGQQPGTDIGELPPGYAPLPQSWIAQAAAAADVIERGGIAASTPPTSTGGGSTIASSGSKSTSAAAVPAPAQQSSATITTDPVVTGEVAGALAGAATPEDPDVGPLGAAVPLGVAAGIIAAVAVAALSRLRRRA